MARFAALPYAKRICRPLAYLSQGGACACAGAGACACASACAGACARACANACAGARANLCRLSNLSCGSIALFLNCLAPGFLLLVVHFPLREH